MVDKVDSYRFLKRTTRQLVRSWIALESPREIPWTPVTKPIGDCTVALITSGGIALKNDLPFDQEGERRNPWWGDPSFRIIPSSASASDIRVYHLHVNPTLAEKDINCLFPLKHLKSYENQGEIGRSSPRHYSFMGYLPQPSTFLEESVPKMIEHLQEDHVDLVILIPA